MKLVKSYLIINEYNERLGTITETNNGNYHLQMYNGAIDFEDTEENIINYILDKMHCDFSEVKKMKNETITETPATLDELNEIYEIFGL